MARDWSEAIFVVLNALSGQSFTLDALMSLVIDDPVAKTGPVIACFAYAWWKGGERVQHDRRRRILLVTLSSLFIIAPAMKALSSGGFSPRPLVHSEQVYTLDGDARLTPLPRLAYRPPLTGDAATRHRALRAGEIDPNDLASFPSDHAALFLALAVGIFLAARTAGGIALVWTVLFTLGARVVSGLHSPLDIVAGGAIGVGLLLVCLAAARLIPQRLSEAILRAADRWPGVAAALVVLALFEVANAFGTLRRLAELGAAIAGFGS